MEIIIILVCILMVLIYFIGYWFGYLRGCGNIAFKEGEIKRLVEENEQWRADLNSIKHKLVQAEKEAGWH